MTSAIGMAKGMNHMSNAHPDEAMETLDAAMEKVHQLQQQLAAAREALQAAEADAARYRWIRQSGEQQDWASALSYVDMDTAIDAALATLQRDRQP